MTTKRTPDPAGLLGDQVSVEIDGAPDDLRSTKKLIGVLSPASRIEALRRHPELIELADSLAARLVGPRKRADMHLMHDIAQAEYRALYLKAAPAATVGNRATQQRKRAGFSSGQERAAERKPTWDAWQHRASALHAENPRRSKSDICAQVGREFGVTGRAVAKRVQIVGTERPRSKD